MAIAVDNAGVSSDAASFSFVLGGGSDRIVVFGGATETADITNVTFNGVGMTFQTLATSTEVRVEFWYMKEAQLPVAGTYTIAVTGTAANSMHGAASFTGVDQTTPFSTPVTASGTASPVTVDVTGTLTTDMVVDFAGIKDPGTVTIGAGQSLGWNALGTDVQGMGSREPGNGGTITMSWTMTASVGWATIAAALKAAAEAGGGGPGPLWMTW